jgi:hypothetical protein
LYFGGYPFNLLLSVLLVACMDQKNVEDLIKAKGGGLSQDGSTVSVHLYLVTEIVVGIELTNKVGCGAYVGRYCLFKVDMVRKAGHMFE